MEMCSKGLQSCWISFYTWVLIGSPEAQLVLPYLTAPHPELHSQAPQLSVVSFSSQRIEATQKLHSDVHQREGEASIKAY